MKRFLNIITLILLFLFPIASPILAEDITDTVTTTDTSSGDYSLETQVDDNTTMATNKYFDLTLTQGLQSPLDKSITYKLTIVPHFDSSKTQILWDSSSTIQITPKHTEFVSLTAEAEYTYKAVIKPTVAGTYNISASVISWQYDTNYTNNVTNTLTLNSSLVSQPITPEYTIALVIEILVIIGVMALIIWGGSRLYKVVLGKAKNWLTPPR